MISAIQMWFMYREHPHHPIHSSRNNHVHHHYHLHRLLHHLSQNKARKSRTTTRRTRTRRRRAQSWRGVRGHAIRGVHALLPHWRPQLHHAQDRKVCHPARLWVVKSVVNEECTRWNARQRQECLWIEEWGRMATCMHDGRAGAWVYAHPYQKQQSYKTILQGINRAQTW